MRRDRPGYQQRKNRDGSITRYWNPKRVKGRLPVNALPSTVRLDDDLTDEEVASMCRQLTQALHSGWAPNISPMERKRPHVIERLMRIYRKRARDTGKPFSIDPYWLHRKLEALDDRCELSGLRFNYDPKHPDTKKHFKHPMRPSLDRIDNNGGYTHDNVRIVLHCVNIGINEWGVENYLYVCRAVANHCAIMALTIPPRSRGPRKVDIAA